MALITPTVLLAANTYYSLSLYPSITDTAANPLQSYYLYFTTE